MAGSVNRALIVGNLGTDPEIRNLPSGQKVANLSVATSDTWNDRDTGERKERTEWHRVSVFNQNSVRYAEQYLRKGDKVYVQGRVETRQWQDQSGAERYTTEVVVPPFGGELIGLSARSGDSIGGIAQDRSQLQAYDDPNGDIPF